MRTPGLMLSRRALMAAATLSLLLAACGGGQGGGGDSGSTGAGAGTQRYSGASLQDAAVLSPTCSWQAVLSDKMLNVFYPDKAATYWIASVPAIPGTRVRIEGQYPRARYFSFNAYDAAQRPVDHLADYEMLALPPGGNPYADRNAAQDGRYVAFVKPEALPEQREPGTIYAAMTRLPAGQSAPVNPQIELAYRIYLGEGDVQGSAPLPRLTLETADGSRAITTLSDCNTLPFVDQLDTVNAALRDSSYPTLPLISTGGDATPDFFRFYGIPGAFADYFGSRAGQPLPANPATQDSSGGFLSNKDNAYVFAVLDRGLGDAYIVRGRAPVAARHPSEAPNGSAQLRYWSLCTNEFFSQRFVDCLYDREVAVDAEGFYTLIVTDAAHKPDWLARVPGLSWLPWGAYPDSVLIYRHMLPSAGFRQAIQNIPQGTPPSEVMGDYLPKAIYCPVTVMQAGNTAEAVFRACQEHGEGS